MKIKRTHSHSLLISVLLTLSAVVFPLNAHASVIYDGYADISFCLNRVSATSHNGNSPGACYVNGQGGQTVTDGWTVIATSSVFDADTYSDGSGVAFIENNLLSTDSWVLGDDYWQTSESWGEVAISGSADSYSDSELSILFTNNIDSPLTFELLYSTYVVADVDQLLGGADDAGAYAEIILFDSVSSGDLLFSSAEAFVGGDLLSSEELDGSFSFTVQPGDSYELQGIVYTDGYATAVPEPTTFWLMCLGIILLISLRTHNRLNS